MNALFQIGIIDRSLCHKDMSTPSGNPESQANCCSRLLFIWVGPLLSTGFKRALRPDDLWPLRAEDEAEHLYTLFEAAWGEEGRRRGGDAAANEASAKGYMSRVLWRLFRGKLLLSAMLYLLYVGSQLGSPVLVQLLVEHLENRTGSGYDASVVESPRGWILVAAFLLLQLLQTFFQTAHDFICVRIGCNARAALVTAVFRRSMALTAGRRPPPAKLLNLMSTDTERLVDFIRMMHRIWTAPLVVIAGVSYIYVIIGPAVFAGLAFMLAFVPLSIRFAGAMWKLQREKMGFTDRRLKVTSEVVLGAKVRVAEVTSNSGAVGEGGGRRNRSLVVVTTTVYTAMVDQIHDP